MRNDLAHRCRFEAHDAIDEDRAVEIGFGEAVGFRHQLAMDAAVSETERIEVRCQMADDAIGADQHQRADRILRCAQRCRRRHLETRDLRAAFDLVANRALGFAVVARQSADEIADRCRSSFRRAESGGAHAGPPE